MSKGCKTMKRTGLTCGLLSAISIVGAAFAADTTANSWQAYEDSWDGQWTDVNHWSLGELRGAAKVALAATAEVDAMTVTVPSGAYSNTMSSVTLSPADGKKVVFDGTAGDFSTYGTVNFSARDKKFAYMEGTKQQFDNVICTVDASRPGVSEAVFSQGVVRPNVFYLFNDYLTPTNIVRFTNGGSVAGTASFQFAIAAPYNALVFDGGTHEIPPNQFPNINAAGYSKTARTHTEFVITNGASVTMVQNATFVFGNDYPASGGDTYAAKSLHLLLDNASTLTLAASLFNVGGSTMTVDVKDGSTLTMPTSTSAFWAGKRNAQGQTGDCSTGIVNVVRSTLKVATTGSAGLGSDKDDCTSYGELSLSDHSEAEFWWQLNIQGRAFDCKRGLLSICGGSRFSAAQLTGTSLARLEADGGCFRYLPRDGVTDCLYGFGSAEIGANGFVIDSNGTKGITVRQSFSNLGEESGVLVLTGSDVKTLAGMETDVDTIAVARGTMAFAAGVSVASSVIVTNGATFKVVNGASAAVKNLTVGAEGTVGVFSLPSDGTTVLTVSGVVSFANATLQANAKLAEGTYTPVVCGTPLSAAAKRQWERLVLAADYVAAGKVADFQAVDANGGTELRVVIRDAEPLDIIVADGETSNVTWRVRTAPADTLTVSVGEEATCAISGEAGDGNLVKDGIGALYLSGLNNYFAFGYTLLGGLLSVDNAGALGFADNTNAALLKDGTLEFAGTEPIRAMTPFNVNCASQYGATVIKANCDVTMPMPSITRGNLIKRGPGRLTLETSANKTLNGNSNYGHVGSAAQPPDKLYLVEFDDAFGNVPYSEDASCQAKAIYTPVTVAEGELCLKGLGETAPTVSYSHGFFVGIATKDGTVQPRLTIDHLNANFTSGGPSFEIACGVQSGYLSQSAGLVITNGATANFSTQFLTLYQCGASYVTSTVEVVDHSVLKADNANGKGFNASFAQGGVSDGSSRYFFRDKSKLLVTASAVSCYGLVEFDFDDSTCDLYSTINLDANSVDSIFRFRNGSLFKGGFSGAQTLKTPVLFSNAEWQPGRGDIAVGGGTTPTMTIAVADEGLVLAPAAGETWTLGTTVSGEGGVVNCGEGTLKLTADKVQFTGRIGAESGVLDLDDQEYASRFVVPGGSIRNGTLTSPTFSVGLDADGQAERQIVLADADELVLSGRVRVDFGRTEENPIVLPSGPIVIGTYSGAAPDVSGWKLVGTGLKGVGGTFAAADGQIVVTPEHRGLMLIVR